MTTTVGNYADVLLRGRYGEVKYQPVIATAPSLSINDSTILQGSGLISTGTRFRAYEATISGEYLKQNQGYTTYNGLYSLLFRVNGGLRLIGRVGYESVFDPGVTDLKGLIWTGGASIEPGPLSHIRVEYGERYEHNVWSADALVALTAKLLVSGGYSEYLQTEQSRLERTLDELISPTPTFPIGTPTLPDIILQNLITGTFLSKDTNFGLSFVFKRSSLPQLTALRYFALTGHLYERISPSSGSDRTVAIDFIYSDQLWRQLGTSFSLGFDKGSATLVNTTKNSVYRAEWQLNYDLTDSAIASLNYTWQKNYLEQGEAIPENVLSVSFRKSF